MKPSPSSKTAIKTSSAVQTEKTINSTLAVGRNDAAFYRKMMPGWRCRLREFLVESLEEEIEDLVQLQVNSTFLSFSFAGDRGANEFG